MADMQMGRGLAAQVLAIRPDPTFQIGARLRKAEVEYLNGAIELALAADPAAQAGDVSGELLEWTRVLERTLVYYIGIDRGAGDEEGARAKTLTLNMVRATLAKVGPPPARRRGRAGR